LFFEKNTAAVHAKADSYEGIDHDQGSCVLVWDAHTICALVLNALLPPKPLL